MESKFKIALLGGDLRQYATAVGLARRGWNIQLWGMEKAALREQGMITCQSVQEAMADVSGVVLPLPASIDGVTLNCPMRAADHGINLMELLDMMIPGSFIVGGKIPDAIQKEALDRGIRCLDYYQSEAFQMENAYLTAEAALGIAMNHLDVSVRGANFAITGFGRIAKHLTFLLLKLGAKVTVLARNPYDRALAESIGCYSATLEPLEQGGFFTLLHGFDVIYNTVPKWLFDRCFLEKMDAHTFLIDLASAPGGVDVCAAKELGANVLWATSLPGKYAPQSAGNLICACVDEILRGEVQKT